MSAVSKSLILGTLACAIALAGCSGDDGGGDPPAGGAGGQGGAGGTNPQGGAGGMNPAAGVGGMNPAGGMGGGGTGGTGGVGGGGTGGMNPQGGDGGGGTGGPIMCETPDDIRSGQMCEDAAEGVFAIKTVIDVWWQDDAVPPLVDPGRGTITIYLKGELSDVCADGSNGQGVIKGCGTELP